MFNAKNIYIFTYEEKNIKIILLNKLPVLVLTGRNKIVIKFEGDRAAEHSM